MFVPAYNDLGRSEAQLGNAAASEICTMTGGSSGDGWFRVVDGTTELVSNTSIGPTDNAWPAGPQLGTDAKALYENMSKTYGGR
ncbi:hypothetical protein SALBM311S_07796 [Streptomyces alboniger]